MTDSIQKFNVEKAPAVKPREYLNGTPASENEYFLYLTGRFAPKDTAVMQVEKADDVINGNVQNSINRLEKERNQVCNILSTNKQSTYDSLSETENQKKINFTEYKAENNINTKTDTTNILKNIQYANEEEKAVVEGAIKTMTEWIDDYINNYDSKTKEGNERGDSELKLSFLLELRKAIENVDFPLGFGDYSDPGDELTLGSYNFNIGGYDNFYHLNTQRSILLNPKFLMPDRKYTSYDQIIDKITSEPDTEIYYSDLVFASDEGYYNYCTNYMASVLVHELTHSMHIYNEAVTYYANDCFDDDFYNQLVPGVDNELLSKYFSLGEGVKFGDLGISHELDGFEDAVEHGHKNNMDYEGLYVNKGFTIDDDRNELRNFIYEA